jgi:hypothetical protein
MYVLPKTIEDATNNGNILAQGNKKSPRCDQIVDMLVNSVSPGAELAARILLRLMEKNPWQAIRGIHPSPNDPTRHMRLDIRGVSYHLRLDAKNVIFDITYVDSAGATRRLSGREPWLRPGA